MGRPPAIGTRQAERGKTMTGWRGTLRRDRVRGVGKFEVPTLLSGRHLTLSACHFQPQMLSTLGSLEATYTVQVDVEATQFHQSQTNSDHTAFCQMRYSE